MRLFLSQFAGAGLVDVTVKALIVVALAGFIAALLRRSAASTRHAIWLTATVTLVTLPIGGVALPQLWLPLLPAEPAVVSSEYGARPFDVAVTQSAPIDESLTASSPAWTVSGRSWSTVGLVVWCAGVINHGLRPWLQEGP